MKYELLCRYIVCFPPYNLVGNLSSFLKKRCVWCIEGGFFFYPLIVITYLLSWVLPRPEHTGIIFNTLENVSPPPKKMQC